MKIRKFNTNTLSNLYRLSDLDNVLYSNCTLIPLGQNPIQDHATFTVMSQYPLI